MKFTNISNEKVNASCQVFKTWQVFFISFFIVFYFNNTLASDSTHTQRNTIWQDIGNDFMIGLNDAGGYITLPLHTTGKQWFFTVGIIDALVISSTTDAALKEKVNSKTKNDYNHNFWDVPTFYGEPIFDAILSGGVYLTGLFAKNNSVRTTGRMLIESIALATAADLLLRYTAGRYRPYLTDNQYKFKLFQTSDDHISLPSGHTTLAFAVSTVLAERIDNAYARIGLYTFAGLNACARVANNKHWLSDVLTGGILGFGTGWFVVHSPTLTPEGEGKKLQSYLPYKRLNKKGKNDSGLSIYPSLNGLNLVWKW